MSDEATSHHDDAAVTTATMVAADARATSDNADAGTPSTTGAPGASGAPLDADAVLYDLRATWPRVLASFVDDPVAAVAEADRLVMRAVDVVIDELRRRADTLHQRWTDASGDADTEELRLTIRALHDLLDRIGSGR
jgi:hypothetical protein